MNTNFNDKVKLEDNHEDVLAKAMRGLGKGKTEVSAILGMPKSRINKVLDGGIDDEVIARLAPLLGLDAEKLLDSSYQKWFPPTIEVEQLSQFNLPYGSMFVNSYLIWDQSSKEAWLFDTGPNATPIVEAIKSRGLSLKAIFLTHTHPDHVACLDEVKVKTGTPTVFVHELERIVDACAIQGGFESAMGALSLLALHTSGHSLGGVSYLVKGLAKPIIVCGDSLFAGSMGGGMISFPEALQNNREKLMVLASETVVCPGHGPMTTIGEEKKHNPFFPEF